MTGHALGRVAIDNVGPLLQHQVTRAVRVTAPKQVRVASSREAVTTVTARTARHLPAQVQVPTDQDPARGRNATAIPRFTSEDLRILARTRRSPAQAAHHQHGRAVPKQTANLRKGRDVRAPQHPRVFARKR